MIEILVGGRTESQSLIAYVIQGLIVNAEGLVCVHAQLMHRQRRIVWLNDHLRHLKSSVGVGVDWVWGWVDGMRRKGGL